jgi:hypothetical protein
MTLDEIVAAHIRGYQSSARRELRFFELQRSLRDAIRWAALCLLPSGKRHSHQRRIPESLLREGEHRLQLVADQSAKVCYFTELHGLAQQVIGSIPGTVRRPSTTRHIA